MPTVLLTCAGRRHYLASYFQSALRGSGKVIGTDMDLSAPALQACDTRHKVPGVFSDHYLDALLKVIMKENVDMVFSLNDLEAGLLAEHREEIERKTGAVVYVPPVNTLSVCSDKWHTYQFARELGIRTPATYLSVEAAVAAIGAGEVCFP